MKTISEILNESNVSHSGYSTNGYNLFGDKKSIDAVRQWHHDSVELVPYLRQRIKELQDSVTKVAKLNRMGRVRGR